MKIIATEKFLKIIEAQMLYDPDNPEEPLELYDTETFDIEVEDELPVVTPEEAMGKIEKGGDEEEVVEPLPEIEPPEDYPAFPSASQAMRWAKHNNKTIRIEYKCRSGRVITRDVEPHGDFFARTTHRRIFVTHDQQVNDVRSFIGQNILDYVFTGQDFEPRFNFSVRRRNYMRRMRRKLTNKNK